VRGFGEGGDKKYNFNTSDKMCTVSWDVDYFSRSQCKTGCLTIGWQTIAD
jgi:hypothetical protein